MKLRLPHIPRPHWPHRAELPEAPEAVLSELGGVLRFFRIAALAAIAVVITTASAASFAESYRGLWLWAHHHGLSGFWAAVMPLQVDTFIVVGELSLFVAMLDRWDRRQRAGAWSVALLGLAVSVAGNIGHLAVADAQTRATAAIPPLSAFVALWVGLGTLKRVVSQRPAAPESVSQLTDLPDLVPAADAVWAPVPDSAESAALASLRATLAAGNPWSGRQLETRFGLTRQQAAKVRQAVLAGANGHGPQDDPGDAVS